MGHEDLNTNWVGAGHLIIGDTIKQADGTTGVVANVTTIQQPQEMFNLTVDEAHTFYVGTNGWLVHNCPSAGEVVSEFGRRPCSNTTVKAAAQKIDSGDFVNGRMVVNVNSRTEAEELLLGKFAGDGAQNVTGELPGLQFPRYANRPQYHWDEAMDPNKPGWLAGHGNGNSHVHSPHLEVHLPNGNTIWVMFPWPK